MHKNMAGKLDKRISILREYQADDGHNGKISNFRNLADAWAQAYISSGSEDYRFNRVFSKDNYVFVIRSRSDLEITTKDVIEYDGVRMNIKSTTKIDGRELYMALEAEKGAGV